MSKKLQVIDFFCGAGGFSEGFRQQGFEIVMGIDNWQPAIDSHNLNHNLNDTKKNILDFWDSIDDIHNLPDTEVIIGSPSCVSFSMSNNSGKADKTLGVQLIESFLRVVAVKKHQPNSKLKAWYMENVPKSREHVKENYTFKDLNLSQWAKFNKKDPKSIALNVRNNGGIYNAGDYGAPQNRIRFVTGEWVETGEFLDPIITHKDHITSCDIRNVLPCPTEVSKKKCIDPNYKKLKIPITQLTDHFYDTGLYKIEWEKAQHLKTNHPFMGKMSFPENEARTSRTITATRSASTRESLIYKSEHNRRGNGQYRLPTIREIACLMGYPIVYQFIGSEGSKWRQIGNSVCPHMSAALAMSLMKKVRQPTVEVENINFSTLKLNFKNKLLINLNTHKKKLFNSPRKRMPNARFRRHPLKIGNMTVDLMNYHPDDKIKVGKSWHLSTYYGTGLSHGTKIISKNDFKEIEDILVENFKTSEFKKFKMEIENKIITDIDLQKTYEEDLKLTDDNNPLIILKRLSKIIKSYKTYTHEIKTGDTFPKDNVPMAQIMAMYGILRLIHPTI